MNHFEWFPAPYQITFGVDIMTLYLAIDKDHTLTLYCEKDQIPKVNKMLQELSLYEPLGIT